MKCCCFLAVLVVAMVVKGSSGSSYHYTPSPTKRPTQAPVQAPAPTGPSTDVDIVGCFSKDMTVEVQDRGAVAMKDLRIGDKVLTGRTFGYSTVYAFGHYAPNVTGEFLKIHTTATADVNNNQNVPLEITGDHLLYREDKSNPVRASSIQVGDILQPHAARVTKIEKVTKTGLYAPLTVEAQVMVNGIQASSYIALQPPSSRGGDDDEYGVFQNGSPFISLHNGVHMVLTPFRMICANRLVLMAATTTTTTAFCHSYNENGMPHHVGNGIQILQWIDQQSWQFQATLFVVAFPFFGIMMVLEKFWLVAVLGLMVTTTMKIWKVRVYFRRHEYHPHHDDKIIKTA